MGGWVAWLVGGWVDWWVGGWVAPGAEMVLFSDLPS